MMTRCIQKPTKDVDFCVSNIGSWSEKGVPESLVLSIQEKSLAARCKNTSLNNKEKRENKRMCGCTIIEIDAIKVADQLPLPPTLASDPHPSKRFQEKGKNRQSDISLTRYRISYQTQKFQLGTSRSQIPNNIPSLHSIPRQYDGS